MATFHPDPGSNKNRRQGVGVLVFIGLALVMTYLPPDRQGEVAAVLRSTVLRPFIATQELVARTRIQTGDVTVLRSRMDSLVSVLTNQRTLAEENRRLRSLLDLERRIGVDYRPASLLRPGTEGSESMFLVDVDGMDSVRVGAPVIVREGLVGVVREIGPGGALGMDWTHPDFRASAMTADGATYGIVEPGQGEFPRADRLILTGTPFTTRLQPGTWIVTSGRGGVYPRGIPIGTVEGLAESEGGWRKSYTLEPAVQLGAVTHVLVGVGTRPIPVGTAPDSADGTDAPGGPPSEGAEVRDLRPIMLPSDSISDEGTADARESDDAAPTPDAGATPPPPTVDTTAPFPTPGDTSGASPGVR